MIRHFLGIPIELAEPTPRSTRAPLDSPDLHRWVMELPRFDDDPEPSGEKIPEAIQMAWIDGVN